MEPYARRVRSIVSVVTPHYGTPVAGFFTGVMGKELLELLSFATIYGLRFGRLPLTALWRVGAALASAARDVGMFRNTLMEQLYQQLLADFSPERRRSVERFLRDVSGDQALLPQLTPDGMDLFNATTSNREGIRYGCVISRAQPPGLRTTLAAGLDAYSQATHAVYVALHGLAARMDPERAPALEEHHLRLLESTYGPEAGLGANDGLVPTQSQVWGEIIHAARGDHLDVIGHFDDHSHDPPHFDWLTTGSGFNRAGFEALWQDVARFIRESELE